ncbi:hypothetical protein [Sulfurisphaera ohwakuensis]|uniref:Uncharacterized protein n=1 Tax=Sulfurisphaera ohwakuensis TaxID=69656 RepID=A0A650CJN8_SULOH|nr:hypothetical protein [Sulfurisphaera ohwakuensis]MBB5254636.1 hypothetical protein [Sulfurisphaera ohwakuensis]QGR18026.1 hypothetical protein D1869_13145 [Sulfurisphaera ohwakuensis]
MCRVIYGYKDLTDEIKQYYILDPIGFSNYKKKLAFDLNFKLQRENSEKLRDLYFTIFELSSIMRELNFRMINPNYALPSLINKINTSLPLLWKNSEISLRQPVKIETQTNFNENIESSVTIDLFQLTGIKNFELKARLKIENKKLTATLDLSLKIENKGVSKNVNEEEINKLLQVTAREVNQKSLISQSQLDEIGENLIESMIEPVLLREREEFEIKTGIKDFIYIPSNRALLLNASESALSDEEIVQLFSDKCIFAIQRVKEGIKNFKSLFSAGVKNENGILYWSNESIYKAPPSVKSLALIDAELSTIKGKALIVIEYPEEYLVEEEIDRIIQLLKNLDKEHEVIIITGNRKIKESCEK